jgi:hypothetical protein
MFFLHVVLPPPPTTELRYGMLLIADLPRERPISSANHLFSVLYASNVFHWLPISFARAGSNVQVLVQWRPSGVSCEVPTPRTYKKVTLFPYTSLRTSVNTNVVPISPIVVTLIKEALRSSETSVLTRATRRNIPEDGILLSHRRENLKSYIALTAWPL